jgi:hypothetical protein
VNMSYKNQSLMASVVASAILMSGVASASDVIDVKNVADPGRHPYQQTAAFNCLPQSCSLVFPAITTARTVILHASCAIQLVTYQIIASVSLSDSTLQIPSFLPITKYADDSVGGESFYVAVSDPYAFFETGEKPTISVDARGGQSAVFVNCTLTGYYM